jgi:uncharacterized protein with von Willebrand factor type A (vWA) domain
MIPEFRSTWRRAGALGVIALAVVLCGCSARKKASVDPFDALRTEVAGQVADPSRAEKMQSAVEKQEAAMDELLQLSTRKAEALAALVGDYDSSREEFDALFAEYFRDRRLIVERMFAAHLELKALATEEEWKHLAKKGNEVMAGVAGQNLGMSLDDGEE